MDNLSKRLSDESAEIRRRAVLELERVDTDEVLSLLMTALGDPDWRVRKEAAFVASRFAHQAAVILALIEATDADENIGLKNAALHALSLGGERAISAVIARLDAESPDTRKTAIDIVGLSRDRRAVAVLRQALSDPDVNVQSAAAEWLGEYAENEAGEALLSCLNRQNSLLRLVALQSLEKIGTPVSYEHLEPLLDDPLLEEVLVPILGASGAPQAVEEVARRLSTDSQAPAAITRLHDENETLAAQVKTALQLTDDDTHRALWQFIETQTGDHQRAAIRCALWMKRKSDMPQIISLAPNSQFYPILVEELSKWGEVAVDALQEKLATETEHRLASVIGLLYRLLDDESGRKFANMFEKLLDSEHPAVVTAAASAVTRFSDHGVVPKLLSLIHSDSNRIRNAAGAALLALATRYPDVVLEKVRAEPVTGKAGIQLCRVLAEVGGEAEEPAVSDAVTAKDSELRRCALRALAKLVGAKAVDKVAKALSDPELSVRMAAVDALALIGPQADNAIAAAIPHATGPVAPALVRALGKVGHKDAAAILREACRRSGDVALAAIEAAEKLGISQDEISIELLFDHPDKEVVKTALNLFGSYLPESPLMNLLSHPEWDVRLAAAKQIDNTQVASSLLTRSLVARSNEEENDLVKEALAEALKKGEKRS